MVFALAACAGDSTGTLSMPSQTQEYAAPDGIPGRWQLAATGSATCIMTFGGAADAKEGTIAPEGGCPGNFFTSRKWTLEQGSLVIRDHTGAVLATLAASGGGRFDGKAMNGIVVTLTR